MILQVFYETLQMYIYIYIHIYTHIYIYIYVCFYLYMLFYIMFSCTCTYISVLWPLTNTLRVPIIVSLLYVIKAPSPLTITHSWVYKSWLICFKGEPIINGVTMKIMDYAKLSDKDYEVILNDALLGIFTKIWLLNLTYEKYMSGH